MQHTILPNGETTNGNSATHITSTPAPPPVFFYAFVKTNIAKQMDDSFECVIEEQGDINKEIARTFLATHNPLITFYTCKIKLGNSLSDGFPAGFYIKTSKLPVAGFLKMEDILHCYPITKKSCFMRTLVACSPSLDDLYEQTLDYFLPESKDDSGALPAGDFYEFINKKIKNAISSHLNNLGWYCTEKYNEFDNTDINLEEVTTTIIKIVNYLFLIRLALWEIPQTKAVTRLLQATMDIQSAMWASLYKFRCKVIREHEEEKIEIPEAFAALASNNKMAYEKTYTFEAAPRALNKKSANLNFKSDSHEIPLSNTDFLFMGDLHSNAIKLLHELIQENFIRTPRPNFYNELHALYLSIESGTFTHAEKKAWIDLIVKITSANPSTMMNYVSLGDSIYDRGAHDFVAILNLLLLHKLNIRVITHWSNHEREFLKLYEVYGFDPARFDRETYDYGFIFEEVVVRSAVNLIASLRNGIITPKEMIYLVENFYLPTLTAITLFIDKKHKTMVFGTHAPVGLSILPCLAQQFRITIPGIDTIDNIERSVHIINDKFTEFKNTKTLYINSLPHTALHDLCWYRRTEHPDELDIRLHDVIPDGWDIVYIHGHDGEQTIQDIARHKTVVNLNNTYGSADIHASPLVQHYYVGSNKHFVKQREKKFAPKPSAPTSSPTASPRQFLAPLPPMQFPLLSLLSSLNSTASTNTLAPPQANSLPPLNLSTLTLPNVPATSSVTLSPPGTTLFPARRNTLTPLTSPPILPAPNTPRGG